MRTNQVRQHATFQARLALGVVLMATFVLSGLLIGHAQSPPAPAQAGPQSGETERVPVRRVVLYKSGVGYFEHLGRVEDDQSVTIDFTSGQLDDVLKSLTTLDLGGGSIASVSFNSQDSLDRRLGALRLPVGADTTRAQFLSALRGARLLVRQGSRRIEGRLLSVERISRDSERGVSQVDALSLVGDDGRMETIALEPGVSVQVTEADLGEEVSRYLSLVSSVRDQDLRQLTIAATGTGARDLFVSYVSEVPVWKATYRLVLPDRDAGRQPLLQGWAVIDNTVGEDWVDVELSLVAGAPQSFIQRISQPYYLQRPVVAMPERFQLTPQTHQPTLELNPPARGESGATQASGAGSRDTGVGGRLDFRMSGQVNRTLDGVAVAPSAAPGPLPRALDRIEEVQYQQTAQATAADLGDLFEYTLSEPVTILKNQSALVPILSGEVEAERVSLWNPSIAAGRPLRAVWLTNTSGLTLDGGTFSVIDGDAFAGEGLVEPLQAGERRLLSYAVDLGLVVDATLESRPTRVTRVSIARGVLVQTTEARQQRVYTARNRDDTARDLVIEHPARDGWTVTSSVAAEETTEAWHRFRLPIESGASASITVDESQSVDRRYAVTNVTDDIIATFVRNQAMTPAVEAALRDVLNRQASLARVAAAIASRTGEVAAIGQDQERVRENMRALRGSSEERRLLERYVAQLDAQETRLETLRTELATLTAEHARQQDELDQFVETLSTT